MLSQDDPQIYQLIKQELKRQQTNITLIPSENHTSKAVLTALGSRLNDKYSEGYPKKRYYQGQKYIDAVEILAQERAQKLFNVPFVNVQALSGSPANAAIYMALLENNEKIMGLKLSFGGHLTHGAPLTFSSRFFTSVQYTLGENDLLDYDAIEKMAQKEKPKVIVAGFTAYPRVIDFKRFGQIADKVGAYLVTDISHIAGLVVGGAHPSPVDHAHVVMTTTHKTLRGPRGALIMVTEKGLSKNPDLPKKINSAIIPGLQGGPHDNQTAAIAVALKEASNSEFKKYAHQVVKNAKALASELNNLGFDLVSGGTDNHLILIDLSRKKVNGALAAYALEQAGIVLNKNTVPSDKMPPYYPSGIRLGTPAITTRAMHEADMKKIATWMNDVITIIQGQSLPMEKEDRSRFFKKFKESVDKNKKIKLISSDVKKYLQQFPLP